MTGIAPPRPNAPSPFRRLLIWLARRSRSSPRGMRSAFIRMLAAPGAQTIPDGKKRAD
jgi:hypothetical protein